jgi:protein-tyrosine-phosphatase
MASLRILFICIGNSCRSPMAEAIARSIGGDRVEASSVGLSPLGWVADQTIAALRSLGYPADGLSSKGLDQIDLDTVDVVVSLLGQRGLDVIPHGVAIQREAWAIVDPFGEDDELYLEVARELEARIRRLLAENPDAELFSS